MREGAKELKTAHSSGQERTAGKLKEKEQQQQAAKAAKAAKARRALLTVPCFWRDSVFEREVERLTRVR